MIGPRKLTATLPLFLIFEKQKSIKFFLKRNYRSSTFLYAPYTYSGNWIFWKKHLACNPTYLADVIAYQNNTKIGILFEFIDTSDIITIYSMYNLQRNSYVSVLLTPESEVKSIAMLWRSAGFAERELTEFFGVVTVSSADSRNLLLDYNQTNFPLRKEFDVYGSHELKYNKFFDKPTWLENTLNLV